MPCSGQLADSGDAFAKDFETRDIGKGINLLVELSCSTNVSMGEDCAFLFDDRFEGIAANTKKCSHALR